MMETPTTIRWRATFKVPLEIASGPNRRELPGQRAARVAKEREEFVGAWGRAGQPKPPAWPALVIFERHSARPIDDDNLPTAFKALRDELAERWGYKSDSRRAPILWRYSQVKSPEPKVAVFVAAPVQAKACAHCGTLYVAGWERCPKEIYIRG